MEEDRAITRAARSDPDARLLTAADFARMKPARRPGERGPQKAPTKERVSLRLDRDVVAHFKSGGEGWQTRINDTLKKSVRARPSRLTKTRAAKRA
jgi:uncharacterized protein (DUF4415 family)